MSSESVIFEKALERLSEIVGELESGDVSLENALKKYEEGVKLSHACQKQLVSAEKKIEVLTRKLDGEFVTEALDSDEEGAPKQAAKKKKNMTKSKKSVEVDVDRDNDIDENDDEDLLF